MIEGERQTERKRVSEKNKEREREKGSTGEKEESVECKIQYASRRR